MMKYLTLVLLFSSGCGVYSLQKAPNLPKMGQFSNQGKYQPIVRIVQFSKYRNSTLSKLGLFNKRLGSCSGTVIDDNYILTAAHCVIDEKSRMVSGQYEVHIPQKAEAVSAEAVVVNVRSDLALLKGDFKDVIPATLETKTFATGAPASACGYPMGDVDLTCANVEGLVIVEGKYMGHGSMIFGQSGGPLLQIKLSKVEILPGLTVEMPEAVVIGVNHAVSTFGDPNSQAYNTFFASIIGLAGALDMN